jgi:hypothetical protein
MAGAAELRRCAKRPSLDVSLYRHERESHGKREEDPAHESKRTGAAGYFQVADTFERRR